MMMGHVRAIPIQCTSSRKHGTVSVFFHEESEIASLSDIIKPMTQGGHSRYQLL